MKCFAAYYSRIWALSVVLNRVCDCSVSKCSPRLSLYCGQGENSTCPDVWIHKHHKGVIRPLWELASDNRTRIKSENKSLGGSEEVHRPCRNYLKVSFSESNQCVSGSQIWSRTHMFVFLTTVPDPENKDITFLLLLSLVKLEECHYNPSTVTLKSSWPEWSCPKIISASQFSLTHAHLPRRATDSQLKSDTILIFCFLPSFLALTLLLGPIQRLRVTTRVT